MRARYASAYIASNGQPENGYREHTSKRAAIASAKAYRDGCLLLRSGGKAYAVRIDRSGMSHDVLWEWYEHINGGYRTA